MNIYEHIKQSRIYSYLMSGFTAYSLLECLQWIFTLDLTTITTQGGIVVSAVLAALVGLVKLTYSFALYTPPK